jgi:hypothetical protein
MKKYVVLFIHAILLISMTAAVIPVNPTHFQSLYITTSRCPFDIERELWHDATLTLTGDFDGEAVRLRGRGNSTWWHGPDKRPLRLRFGGPVYLMGSEYPARDWILLANHFDRSLLRNYSAFYLGGLMGKMEFVPMAVNIHLYVNGEYMGVYLLTDERDVTPGRMNVAWNADPELSEYFFELDSRAPKNGTENETYVVVHGHPYDIRFPASSGKTPAHMAYVGNYLEAVDNAIRNRDRDEVFRLIDLDTFVDYYLIQELYKNLDAHQLSVFMYIGGRGDDRKLYMGPLWDFDLAAGNYDRQPLGSGPENLYVAVMNDWYYHLMAIPAFFGAVAVRWNEIADAEVAQTVAHIRDTAVRCQADFERNFERHPVMGAALFGSSAAAMAIGDYCGHVDYLVNWLEARTAWLNGYFSGKLPDYTPLGALLDYYTDTQPVTFMIDGLPITTVPSPFILHGRMMAALPVIASCLDASYEYSPSDGIAVMQKGGTVITHQLGSPRFTVNGSVVTSDVASVLIRGQIFMPIGLVARSFGYTVQWYSDTNTVAINTER